MRKPKDFDSALKALTDKTRALKENKRKQLGELIIAAGADALDVEILAGGLLAIVESADKVQKESWRKRGTAFFRRQAQANVGRARSNTESAAPDDGDKASA